jgi:hypothetical protein
MVIARNCAEIVRLAHVNGMAGHLINIIKFSIFSVWYMPDLRLEAE